MSRIHTLCLTVLFLASFAAVPVFGAEKGHADHGEHASERIGDPYPLASDPVTDESLAEVEQPVVHLHEGRELRFADAANVEKFKKNPEKYLAKVDERIIENQMPYYPMTTCPVSGEKLGGEMGEPVDYVYGNRLIRFCCKGCKGDFLKDPSATLEKLDAAVVAQQKENYPLETCPVSGQKLGSMGDPVDMVIANRLLRLCCGGCKGKLMANPAEVLGQVDVAWQASDAKPGAEGADKAGDGHGGHGNHKAGEGGAAGHGQHGADKDSHGGNKKKSRHDDHAGHSH
jgi:YHS domain-containing protein